MQKVMTFFRCLNITIFIVCFLFSSEVKDFWLSFTPAPILLCKRWTSSLTCWKMPSSKYSWRSTFHYYIIFNLYVPCMFCIRNERGGCRWHQHFYHMENNQVTDEPLQRLKILLLVAYRDLGRVSA